jgi:hypothetical protein
MVQHSFIHIPVVPTWSIRHLWNASFHFNFLIFRQTIGLLGRGINPTQGRYLHRTTQTQNKRNYPCLEWDANPRPQCSGGRRQSIWYNYTIIVELERIWKGTAVAYTKNCPSTCLKGLRKRTKDLSADHQDIQCLGRDLNRTCPEYKSGALPLCHSAPLLVLQERLGINPFVGGTSCVFLTFCNVCKYLFGTLCMYYWCCY